MAYLGTNRHGKLVMYPIRNNIDGRGSQLLNWVIEVQCPTEHLIRDWTRKARVEDFISGFENCRFDWLDVPAMLQSAEEVYEYPMVDQEPLPFWTQGRVTLLGDAAHRRATYNGLTRRVRRDGGTGAVRLYRFGRGQIGEVVDGEVILCGAHRRGRRGRRHPVWPYHQRHQASGTLSQGRVRAGGSARSPGRALSRTPHRL